MLRMSRTMHFERKETADRHAWHSDINVVAAVILCLLKSEGNVFPNAECCTNNHVFDPYIINELKNNQRALVTLEKTL